MNNVKRNILLVEDDLDLAATVVDYLELEGISCDHAANGIRGLGLVQSQSYDMVILDVNMPRMDGLLVCRKMREQGIDTPVLMLTARDTLDDKLAGFKVGSDDYLVKPFAMLELVARIHVLAKRRSGQTTSTELYGLSIDFSQKIAKRGQRQLQLSPTGWILLETLVRKSGQIVTRDQLCHAVWGDELPDSNSLKVHLFNLRQQIDAPGESKLIHTVPGQGVALRQQDEG
ncbi:response regulator transcription factor [Thalassomonas haliotis]|uniref:Response regulator transcription factor n=1 Tax=Thalassomonas haliotis TaxID=485448 RepID=A0ABY7V7X0_9GAMM|nr:response regulator transcription factor [Thalassomonas haliotis]WDE09753.1 response regulator transcription factor [Thalassomonas haliotis]